MYGLFVAFGHLFINTMVNLDFKKRNLKLNSFPTTKCFVHHKSSETNMMTTKAKIMAHVGMIAICATILATISIQVP